jgi:hypothetical protein
MRLWVGHANAGGQEVDVLRVTLSLAVSAGCGRLRADWADGQTKLVIAAVSGTAARDSFIALRFVPMHIG